MKKRKINPKRMLLCVFVLVVIIIILYFFVGLVVNVVKDSTPIKLDSGWHKIEEIHGIIPKGSIAVVSIETKLEFPHDLDSRRQDGFANEGIVIFYENMYCTTEGPIWIFYPPEYEFLLKADNFMLQCNEKLSDLTGEEKVSSAYFGGHP